MIIFATKKTASAINVKPIKAIIQNLRFFSYSLRTVLLRNSLILSKASLLISLSTAQIQDLSNIFDAGSAFVQRSPNTYRLLQLVSKTEHTKIIKIFFIS